MLDANGSFRSGAAQITLVSLAIFLVHCNTGRRQLAELGTLAAADAFLLHDVHNAVFVHAHCLVLLGAGFIAGMILAVLANINLVLQLAEFTKSQLDAAVAGSGHTVVNQGTHQLTAGTAHTVAVFFGVLNNMVVFHNVLCTLLCCMIFFTFQAVLKGFEAG